MHITASIPAYYVCKNAYNTLQQLQIWDDPGMQVFSHGTIVAVFQGILYFSYNTVNLYN